MGKYIDRDEAKRHLCQDYAYAAAELLDELPPADVAPVVHGEWIKRIKQVAIFGSLELRYVYTCSECGREADHKEPYCHCGAKMDGGGEDV